MLLAALTATATGLALTVPLGAPAHAALNPVVLKSLHLDSATLEKVQAYDKYRTREANQREKASRALRFARKQIGKPYKWGADGPSSYDCSGLAMAAWRKAGVTLPRVTYAQYRKVDRKVKYGNLEPGDLIFFHGRSHVGLYVGHGRFLHAPHSGARVRINKIGKRRKQQFAGAVRPGAPAYREWSASVRELVEKIDRMSAEKRADKKPPDKERTPHIPPPSDSLPKSDRNPPMTAPGHTPAHQAAPPGRPAPAPDDSAPDTSAPGNSAPGNSAPGDSAPGDSAAQAPRGDAQSNENKPAPRPRTRAAGHRQPVQNHIWAKYTGRAPFGVLA
ncbi:C40 family peptidase [Actinomadura bangladeshensis]|uniref:C40 family peptidase n=1 Tax=Actinomadura bangladeshensis TaxID=453573 RepID=UPI001EF16B11|nr:C40 family peptidase [Actinomadura bangladeshensis]